MNDEAVSEKPPRDRHFDGFRAPASEAASDLVAEVLLQVQNYENYFGLRKRRRRAVDQKIFETTVAAVICDLIHHRLSGLVGGGVAVTRSNRKLANKSRYRPAALGSTLPHVLDLLSKPEMDFIKQNKGRRELAMAHARDDGEAGDTYYKGVTTVLEPGSKLLSRIDRFQITLADVGRLDDEEVIVLKEPKRSGGRDGKRLEYVDTGFTNAARADLRRINCWLADAQIDLDGPWNAHRNPYSRRMLRVFNNGDFEQGGRFFGGFWMALPKKSRREDLSIEGLSPAELDYGQMGLRQLYAKVGASPPPGDLYAIPGYELHRDGIKKLIAAALYSEKAQTRFPRDTRKLFLNRHRYVNVLTDIQAHHTSVADYFFTGMGMKLMRQESDIMVRVLLDLMEKDIVALPIHDSVLVPKPRASEAKVVMERVFREMTGAEPEVRLEA